MIFEYEFIRNALIAIIFIAFVAPIIGVFITMRRLTFIADGLGHINMSGIAFGYLMVSLGIFINIDVMMWALIFSILGIFLIEYFRNHFKTFKEVGIVLVYTLAVALTSIFIHLSNGFNASFFNVLFGNINGISTQELFSIVILSITSLIIIIKYFKKFTITSLDNETAHLYKVNKKKINIIFMIVMAVLITTSIKIAGILLVSGFIILPVLISMKIAKSLKQTFIWAVVISEFSGIAGFLIAYYLNLPTGASIILILFTIFVILNIFKKRG